MNDRPTAAELPNEKHRARYRENNLAAADLAQGRYTQLVSLQASVNAVMSVDSKTMGSSLFDYLTKL